MPMSVVLPFAGWRYDQYQVTLAKVIAPLSSDIDDQLRLELYKADDRNVIRLLAPESWPSSATHLDAWREDGLLVQDKDAVYIVEQEYESEGQRRISRGVIAKLLLGDAGLKEPLAIDRIRAVRGNLEPAVGVFDSATNDALPLERYSSGEPTLDVTDRNGVRHKVWVILPASQIEEIISNIQQVDIPAGGGTYEAAACYRDEVRQCIVNAGRPAPEAGSLDCDYVMAFLIPNAYGAVEEASGACSRLKPVSGLVFYLFW